MDIAAVAVLAGNTLVAAAVTDAWETTRGKIARLFGRGQPDPHVERRLDATREQLATAGPAELERTRAVLAAQWETRFADLLADHPDAAGELDAVLTEITASLRAVANHSVVAGRDVSIRADHGGVAAGVIHGDVTTGPTMPDREFS